MRINNNIRAVVAGAVLLIIGTNIGTWWLVARTRDTHGNPNPYSLVDPSRRFVRQEDLIVNLQPLRDSLNRAYQNDPAVSLYFEYLPTGANISINKDTTFYPASLLKVPVAVAVAKKIERGEWKWTNELVLLAGDRDALFGTLYLEPTNSTHTIEELVARSLVESDNTAHFILLRNLETEEIESVYEHIGLKDFFDTDGSISAKQYSVIFRMLYTSSYLSPEYSNKLLRLMTKSSFGEFVQQSLPDEAVFAHKIGMATDRGVYVDSGIVYAPSRPYIITVMVAASDEIAARRVMADISNSVYTYITSYVEKDS